jgi:hypothetical protein
VRLGIQQIADLDSYSKASGMSRDELIRGAALFFEELRDDEDFYKPGPRAQG